MTTDLQCPSKLKREEAVFSWESVDSIVSFVITVV
jgi:hypothetical protein